ncbi:MAG: hypothetical protein A3F72_16520 [Bacteroidetes bacterium RIFCSPLOWO2_12_FULL_35_15]|nr:MAG: hypothetical protein A3F72_16520 [Bacteroidetes bacterium RIFCSPLOWO2_12_FULL_35_15]
MKKKISLILIVIAVMALETKAQTEIPSFSVSSGEGMIVKDNFSSSYTIGNLFMVTNVSPTENSTQNTLTSVVNPLPDESISNLSVYPNPTSGTIHVDLTLKEEGKINISVYDMLGKKVLDAGLSTENVLSSGVHTQSLDLSNLNNGLYFMEMVFVSSKGISTKTIQKINLNN